MLHKLFFLCIVITFSADIPCKSDGFINLRKDTFLGLHHASFPFSTPQIRILQVLLKFLPPP